MKLFLSFFVFIALALLAVLISGRIWRLPQNTLLTILSAILIAFLAFWASGRGDYEK